MKNVSSLKNSAKESPKTPGGISKSLLTPCRRVGLSRNWKKKGPSPFISPLNTDIPKNVEVKVEKRPTRKRKSAVEPDEKSNEMADSDGEECEITSSITNDIVKTPLRNVELPRKKRSKTFLATLQSQESINEVKSPLSVNIDEYTKENNIPQILPEDDISLVASNPEEDQDEKSEVKSPEPKNVLKKTKFTSPLKSVNVAPLPSKSDTISVEESLKDTTKEVAKPIKEKSESKKTKTRSPNELTKECIVVIQKKLLKVKDKYKHKVDDKLKKTSQPLFDSDSDETPLSSLNKKDNIKACSSTLNKKDNIETEKQSSKLIDDDDEFTATTSRSKAKQMEKKKPSNSEDKTAKTKRSETSKIIPQPKPKPASQCSLDDDDDDFFDKKKTILIRKTYEKIAKPLKAKSTGSITQKDIDDLKARIEVKKKMLLAQTMTHETEELRVLIKKWQKGCQEALMELMDLMKIKCPDKHNMDYSEILQILKIPASLVGYDSDHDCFNTPDDASAVLSNFNDI